MSLLWSVRLRSTEVGSGTFACPRCGLDRPYVRKESRRVRRVLFLPPVPLSVLDEYIECVACQDGFDPTVLQVPTLENLRVELLAAVRESVVLLLDAGAGAASRAEALAMLSAYAGRPWPEEQLDRDREHAKTRRLTGRLQLLAPTLSDHGKQRLVTWAARVAAADGLLANQRAHVVECIADDLGMAPGQARDILLTLAGQPV